MAIPGLVNVIAQEHNVHVDQKLEIHDPEDLIFEAKDDRIGKYRSVYLRNKFDGTESTYTNLESDRAFYESIGESRSRSRSRSSASSIATSVHGGSHGN